MKELKSRVLLFFKGIAMGAADVVPGVSGGTIAFITGIYEELIDTINRFNAKSLKILFRQGPVAFWRAVNGTFLLVLIAGILTSIASLAGIIVHYLDTQPVAVWSFFFGLVLASIPLVARKVPRWTVSKILSFVVGAIIAYIITTLPPTTNPGSLFYLFISGMIAICAMILPGISGSFILLLMGSYTTVMAAVSEFDVVPLAVFAVGCVVGILSFSRVLKFMFKRFHDITVALLSGFLLGSLNKIWPWKEVIEVFVKHPGEPNEEIVPLLERNVWPGTYEQIAGEPSQWGLALVMFAVGILIIAVLDRFGPKDD